MQKAVVVRNSAGISDKVSPIMADTNKRADPQATPSGWVPLDRVRSKLASLWLIGGALIFSLMVACSLLGAYGENVQDAWGWLLPTLLPTLAMILSVLGYSALSPTLSKINVRRDFYRIALFLSVFYLGLILFTLLIQPFRSVTVAQQLAQMRMSNLWLGPIQGLVSSALGVLFISKQKQAR
jgi:hypothetical protein